MIGVNMWEQIKRFIYTPTNRPPICGVPERKVTPVAEIDMGEGDILVLKTDKKIPKESAVRIKDQVTKIIHGEGRKVLILEDGMTYSIIHKRNEKTE